MEVEKEAVASPRPSPHVIAKTPFHLNRWVILVFYLIYCFLTGPAYFCWASLRQMLQQTGAYQWKCESGVAVDEAGTCEAQRSALKVAYVVGSTGHFVMSAVAGLLLDSFGPKFTAICGITLQAAGWLLVASSTEGFQAYVPGMLIMAMGLDAAFFPCICGSNLFPRYGSSVIAGMGATRSMSFFTPYIMEQILGSSTSQSAFATMFYVFVAVGLGFCMVVAILLIPKRAFTAVSEEPSVQATKDSVPLPSASRRSSRHSYMGLEDWKDIGHSIAGTVRRKSDAKDVKGVPADRLKYQATREDELETVRRRSSVMGSRHLSLKDPEAATAVPGAELVSPVAVEEKAPGATRLAPGSRRSSAAPTAEGRRSRRGSFVPIASASVAVIELGEQKPMTRSERMKSFGREVFSWCYIPMLIYFMFTLQRTIFFGSANDVLLGENELEVFKVMSAMSFAPCPVLGYLADVVGIMPVLVVVNATGTMIIGFAMIPGVPAAPACQYLVSVMFMIHVSFLISQIYCYVADTFSEENMGKLIGLMSAIAGLYNLTTIPMNNFAANDWPNNKSNMLGMMGFLLGTSALNFVFLAIVWIARRKRLKEPPMKVWEVGQFE